MRHLRGAGIVTVKGVAQDQHWSSIESELVVPMSRNGPTSPGREGQWTVALTFLTERVPRGLHFATCSLPVRSAPREAFALHGPFHKCAGSCSSLVLCSYWLKLTQKRNVVDLTKHTGESVSFVWTLFSSWPWATKIKTTKFKSHQIFLDA